MLPKYSIKWPQEDYLETEGEPDSIEAKSLDAEHDVGKVLSEGGTSGPQSIRTSVAIIKAKPVQALEHNDIAIVVSDLAIGGCQASSRLCLCASSHVGVKGDVWKRLVGDAAANDHSTGVTIDCDVDRIEVDKA